MGGDVFTRGSTRILIIVSCVALLVALVGIPLYFKLKSVQTPCHESLSVPLVDPVFLPDSSVVDGYDTYPPGYHFTVNGTTRGCLCVSKPCIRKCCAKDEFFLKRPHSRAVCVKNSGSSPFDSFSFPVYKAPGERVEVDQDHFQIVYGNGCPHGMYALHPEMEKHYLTVNGTVLLADEDLDASKYCLDSRNGSDEIRVFVCFSGHADEEETKIQFTLYPMAMIISSACLIVTIAIYSILPELRKHNWKLFVCQWTCLLLSYLGLVSLQLKSEIISNFWCVFLGFMIQGSFLGSFFWMNVISFDIWWNLSLVRESRDHRKFLLYSLYAWGAPLVIVAISVGMDMIPGIPDSYIKPGFGKRSCWFQDSKGVLLYFYLPTSLVLLLNTAMFVTILFKLKKDSLMQENNRFKLFLNLFIIMGLSWFLELLSFFVGGSKSLWFVTDLYNCLQGVVIFFFFVCKRDILRILSKKLCPSKILCGRTSPTYSTSFRDSDSLARTENIDLALKSQENNARAHQDRQPQIK